MEIILTQITSKQHTILPKFLIKQFEIKSKQKGFVYKLDINKKTIEKITCHSANIKVDFYDADNEKSFSKLESTFARLCKKILEINNNMNGDVFLSQKETKELIKKWSIANYGRVFFNKANAEKTNIKEYEYLKRNSVINSVLNNAELPQTANDFIESSYVILLRNSTQSNFILGSCHWIEAETNGYVICVFPITPKLALCMVEHKWITDNVADIKENDVVAWNYQKNDLVSQFNKAILRGVQGGELAEIYSCSSEELQELLKAL
jgi:hypothetical protein